MCACTRTQHTQIENLKGNQCIYSQQFLTKAENSQRRQNCLFKNGARKMGYRCAEERGWTPSLSIYKINSKWIEDVDMTLNYDTTRRKHKWDASGYPGYWVWARDLGIRPFKHGGGEPKIDKWDYVKLYFLQRKTTRGDSLQRNYFQTIYCRLDWDCLGKATWLNILVAACSKGSWRCRIMKRGP